MKPIAIFRHSPGEGAGYFATFIERRSLPWRLIRVDAGDGVPADPTTFAGLVFMGGPMSVNDPLPWVAAELDLIRAAVAQGIPVLGHCLGGQLMAKALGAVVTRNACKEIGWGDVRVLDNPVAADWFGDLKGFKSFHWHGETFGVPEGATHILASAHCAHQAFALGPHLAMQCHVEMTPEMIADWCVVGADEIATSDGPAVQQADVMQAEMPDHLAALNAIAERLYSHWLAGVKGG